MIFHTGVHKSAALALFSQKGGSLFSPIFLIFILCSSPVYVSSMGPKHCRYIDNSVLFHGQQCFIAEKSIILSLNKHLLAASLKYLCAVFLMCTVVCSIFIHTAQSCRQQASPTTGLLLGASSPWCFSEKHPALP